MSAAAPPVPIEIQLESIRPLAIYDLDDVELMQDTIGRGGSCLVQLAKLKRRKHALVNYVEKKQVNEEPELVTAVSESSAIPVRPAEQPATLLDSNSHSSVSVVDDYVALKVVECMVGGEENKIGLYRLKHEQAILNRLNHPGISKLSVLISIMQLYPYGDLTIHLRHHARRLLSAQTIHTYMSELVAIVCYLHSRGICHRDIKSKNIMVDSHGHLVLIDFGMSQLMSGSTLKADVSTDEGTLNYLSPERLAGEGAVDGFAGDWWALGIVFHELLYGVVPFTGDSDVEIRQHILNYADELPERLFPSRTSLPASAFDLLHGLLKRDPTQRLCSTSDQSQLHIQSHPYFCGINWPSIIDVWSTPSTISFVKHLGALELEI